MAKSFKIKATFMPYLLATSNAIHKQTNSLPEQLENCTTKERFCPLSAFKSTETVRDMMLIFEQ